MIVQVPRTLWFRNPQRRKIGDGGGIEGAIDHRYLMRRCTLRASSWGVNMVHSEGIYHGNQIMNELSYNQTFPFKRFHIADLRPALKIAACVTVSQACGDNIITFKGERTISPHVT